MNKKATIINGILIFVALFGLKFARPILSPNLTESINKEWGINLPTPSEKSKIETSEEDNNENSLYKLTYDNDSDLEKVKLSLNWCFKNDTEDSIPVDIMEVIQNDSENSRYFYKRDNDNMIALSLENNILTVYQSNKSKFFNINNINLRLQNLI